MFQRLMTAMVIVFVAIALLFPSVSQAFDGQRKGFILGGGVGVGGTKFKQESNVLGPYGGSTIAESDWENKTAFVTNFKIGYAFDERWQLYWSQRGSWFEMRNVYSSDVTIMNGVGGAGVTYYFRPTSPSWFLNGTLGISTWALPFESNSDTWVGFGIAFGGGYEFSRFWSVDLTLSSGEPTYDYGVFELKTKANSINITINYLAY